MALLGRRGGGRAEGRRRRSRLAPCLALAVALLPLGAGAQGPAELAGEERAWLAAYRSHGFAAAIDKPWSAQELRRVVAEVGRPAA